MSTDLSALVVRRVRQIREARGLTQTDLGERAGIAPAEISRLERGRRVPRVDTLGRIAEALGVAPASFFEVDGEVEPLAVVEQLDVLLRGQPELVQRQVVAVAEALIGTTRRG